MGAHRFEELDVFQRAYKVSLEIHRFTLTMPQIEQFDLASQIRRASKSICANLAEGFGKQSRSKAERSAASPAPVASASAAVIASGLTGGIETAFRSVMSKSFSGWRQPRARRKQYFGKLAPGTKKGGSSGAAFGVACERLSGCEPAFQFLEAAVADQVDEAILGCVLPAGLGLEGHKAGMRTGIHFGPIYRGVDPVVGNELWYGTEVTRTARIERTTPTNIPETEPCPS